MEIFQKGRRKLTEFIFYLKVKFVSHKERKNSGTMIIKNFGHFLTQLGNCSLIQLFCHFSLYGKSKLYSDLIISRKAGTKLEIFYQIPSQIPKFPKQSHLESYDDATIESSNSVMDSVY